MISLYEFFFTINSDFDCPERQGHGAKVPGSEMARDRKGHGASWPGSESARVLLADSLRGANWPGSEKARYRCTDGMKFVMPNFTQIGATCLPCGAKKPKIAD